MIREERGHWVNSMFTLGEFTHSLCRVGLVRWARLLAALLMGDRRNTLCRIASTRMMVSRAWYWKARWPLAYALWRELRSLPFRILATHETDVARRGVHTGCRKTLAATGLPDNTGGPCRSADIRNLESLFPWITPLDVEIFLLGRMAGEVCHAGKTCTGEHIALSLATSDRVFINSRTTSLKHSTRDRSASLPSQV
jgi:hypothetical protein